MPVQTLKGPWGGMDLREGEAAPNSYFLGLNVDTSAGQLAARPALGLVATGTLARARLHYVDQPGSPKVVLAVGHIGTSLGASIGFRVYTDGFDAVAAVQNLTTTFGETARDDMLCSFVDVLLRPTDTGNPTPAVLVTTDLCTYVYDLTANDGTLRRVAVSTDAQKINNANLYYASHAIPGPITVAHQTRVYYAGFRVGAQVYFDGTLPAAAANKPAQPPEAYVGRDRTYLTLAPHAILWSDEADPVGIAAVNFAVVDPTERITGLHSTGSALLIFTDKGIWGLLGSTVQDFSIQKLVHNTGCVAHESIVTVGAVTYFAGRDGIYAFGGMGAPEAVKISAQLDPMWEGGEQIADQLPEAFRPYISLYGFPWTVNQSWTKRMVGRHYARPNQIWWSLPVSGIWDARAMGLTLIYDVQGNHWNLYFSSPGPRTGSANLTPASNHASVMNDAVQIDGRWVTSSGYTEFWEAGLGRVDGDEVNASNSECVPVYWCSRRFPDSGDDILRIDRLRFKMLTRGLAASASNSSTTVGSGAVPVNKPMWFVEGESAAFDFEDDAGTIVADYDQKATRTGELQCHPRASSSSFLGSIVLGTSKFASTEWFTSDAPVGILSRWFRIGFKDDGVTFVRSPAAQFSSIGIEITNTGATKR